MSKKAVIYCRVSTDEQAKSGTTSLDKQEEACRKYAESHSFEVAGLFKDDYTGTVPIEQRPEGSKAYSILTSGAADALIVFSIDRLVRPPEDGDEWDIPILIRGLAKVGKEIHTSKKGKIDTSFTGLLVAVLDGKAAGDERRTILERMHDGKRDKAKKLNKWVGSGSTPFGYTKIGTRKEAYLEINHHEAQIVRRMFNIYLGREGEARLGMDAMAALFNAEGVAVTGRVKPGKKRPEVGRLWHASTIGQIMGNRAYIGEFVWGNEVVTIPSLAIIPREVFEAMQEQRKLNTRDSKRNTQYNYLMLGRMTCACGRKITTARMRSNGKVYLYYTCNRKYWDTNGNCDRKNMPAAVVDRVVWRWLVDVFKNEEKVLAGVREYQARQREKAKPNRERLEELPKLIAECETQARRLTRTLENTPEEDELGIKSLQDRLGQISAAHKRYKAERERIEAELNDTEVSEANIQQILNWANEIRRAIDTDKISFEARRKLIERLNITAEVEFQNDERGLHLNCPVLSTSKWSGLKTDCLQPLEKDCRQTMPCYTISGWVSLAEAFFGEAVAVTAACLDGV